MHDLTGVTIGQYAVGEQLGRGGMANVYKAYHPGLDVHRAIKVIRPDLSGAKNFEQRFQREARAVASLRHPNIVQVHDFGRHEDLFYMVMEFIDGEDLKARIRRGPVRPFSEAIRIVVELSRALACAHERNILHRDVKPDNIMLSTRGEVILTDFGIAKIVGSQDPQLTAIGTEIGTPNYMAPEMVMGKAAASRAADLYAVGVVLYEALSGRAPFAADTPLAVLHRVVHDPVPPPTSLQADIPVALQGVVLKAMAFDVEQRYPTAEAFIEAAEQSLLGTTPIALPDAGTRPMLARSLDHGATSATAAGTVAGGTVPATVVAAGSQPHRPRRRWAVVAAVAVGLIALALVGVTVVSGRSGAPDRDQVARLLGEPLGNAESLAPEAAATQEPAAERVAPALPQDGHDASPRSLPAAPEGAAEVAEGQLAAETWRPSSLPSSGVLVGTAVQPLAAHDPVAAGSPDAATSGTARDRAGLGRDRRGVQRLPDRVAFGSRTLSGGKLRFGEPAAGDLDPEDTVVYDLEVRRPTYIYFDIIYSSRPAWYTLFDADGNEVFRQGSDLGPFRLESAGWYRLSIETEAEIPIQYEIRFNQVGS